MIDAALRQKIAENNRALVERYFIESMAQAYEALFEKALRERGLSTGSNGLKADDRHAA